MASHAPGAPLALVRRKVGLTQLDVEVGHQDTVSLLMPADGTALLNLYCDHAAEFKGLLPYIGIVWPAAAALSRHLALTDDACIRDAHVLEIGCGVGLAGIVAAKTGAPRSMLQTDVDAAAVALTRLNAERNGVAGVCAAAVKDWHAIETWPAAAFDVVLATDCVYSNDEMSPVARLLTHTLKPGGVLLLANSRGVWRDRNGMDVVQLLTASDMQEGSTSSLLRWERLVGTGDFQLDDQQWMVIEEQPVVIARFVRAKV